MIDVLNSWWETLALPQQVFYGIGIVAAFIAIILAVIGVVGIGDGDALDADPSHSVLSIKSVTGFFLAFGWAGGASMEAGLSLPIAMVLAVLAGCVMVAIIATMMRAIMSIRSDGTARISDTVGAVGTVYVSLPASKSSGGQVTVSFRGRQETFAALNNVDRAVPSGERVKVIGVVDSHTVLVEPLA